MSALDAGQGALGIVWIHNGVAELKGGINWGAGNDTTGDGTPTAPYLTPIQAMKEIRTFEGQEETTKTWEVRLVTDNDEDTDYGAIEWGNDATMPSVIAPHYMILSGWLKSWGDTTRDFWNSISERPKTNRIRRTVAGSSGGAIGRWVVKDLWIDSLSDFWSLRVDINSGDTSIQPGVSAKFFGCVFDTSHSSGLGLTTFAGTGVTSSDPAVGYTGCFMLRRVNGSVINNSVSGNTGHFVNCSMIPRIPETALVAFRSGGSSKTPRTQNCIIAPDGSGFWALENTSDSTTANTDAVRHHNRYWLRNGAKFFRVTFNGANDIDAFTPSGGHDDESSAGDPLVLAVDNPLVTNASPILDKGGVGASYVNMHFDPTGNNFHLYDILHGLLGDSLDANTPDSADATSKWTHRAVGCHQNPLGMVPGLASIDWPVGIINTLTDYVSAPVNADPDQNGTVHFRVLQADDAAMTTNLVVRDSCPLKVDATNNKIDFKEDGGAELTATLTSGDYNTQTLMAEIKAALELAGAGTYTVTYNSTTEITTIAVGGAVTNVQFLFASGTNVGNSARVFIGFDADTASQPSHDSPDAVIENFFDAALAYEFSGTKTDGTNPAADGAPWTAMGLGLPKDSGIEGTDGVLATPGTTRHVRVNIGTLFPTDGKYHAIQFWNGTLKSQNEVV